jgi:hypothetical protein
MLIAAGLKQDPAAAAGSAARATGTEVAARVAIAKTQVIRRARIA